MKHYFTPFLALISATFVLTPLFAAESLEHFVTKDGRHYCSVFMKNDFQSCESFGIRYEGEKLVEGEKPFFAAGFPDIEKVVIGDETYCVEGSATDTGREVEMEKCSNISATNDANTENEPVLLEEVSGNLDQALPEDSDGETVSGEIESSLSEETSVTGSSSGGLSATCSVNGQKVDCEKMMEGATSMVKKGLGILGVVLTVLFILGIFSLWMFIHALSNPISHKALWALCIFFFFPLGSIIYFFVVKRNFVKNAGAQGGSQGAIQTNTQPTGVPVTPAPAFFPDPNPGVIGAYNPPVVAPVVPPVVEVPVSQNTVSVEMPTGVPVAPIVSPVSSPIVTPSEVLAPSPIPESTVAMGIPPSIEGGQSTPEIPTPVAVVPPSESMIAPMTPSVPMSSPPLIPTEVVVPPVSPIMPPTAPQVPPPTNQNQ